MTDNTSEDPFDNDEWRDFAQRAIDDLLPMMKNSAVCVSMVPKDAGDVKFAVELGFSIMLDKPIIAMIAPGSRVSSHLARVADEIVEWDPNGDPAQVAERIRSVVTRLAGDDD